MSVEFGDFIPFGTQYYRAPTPLKEDWARDLRNIRAYGFNTVKYFPQWRWNNPAEGVYYFADLDRLMDLAAENGLRVILNIALDVAPAWFFKKRPESVMITCDGRRLEPQTNASRTVGGAPGPCLNHAEGLRSRIDFITEIVRRYGHHPAMFIWDLWNEPEMTPGILRRPVQADMLCYCGDCRRDFTEWLTRKYGSVDRLNAAWNRNYQDFGEIELPRSGDAFNDMIDWRVYFSEVMTRELRRRAAAVRAVDAETPVMAHTVPMPHFNAVMCCNNDYALAAECDLFGNSVGSHPFAAAFNMSCADGRTVINSEIHAAGGDTYRRPGRPSFEDIKGHILIPLARGVKGFIYWQYRPERLGREAPAWGLAAMDGGRTDALDFNARICKALQDNAALINSVMPAPAEIAVVNSYKGQVFDWCASGSVDLYTGSVIGLFTALYDANLNADIIGLETLSEERLLKYKTVFLPFPYYLDAKTADLLKKWIAAGGRLISEALFGCVSEEDGLHSIEVPGYGFSEIFGAREGSVRIGAKFTNAYDGSMSAENRYCPVPVKTPGLNFDGHYFMEELLPTTAEVLGAFEDGTPAITSGKYGSGDAILIGTLAGYAYSKTKAADISTMLCRLAARDPVVRVEGGKVRADLLTGPDCTAVLVLNGSNGEAADLTITIYAPLKSAEALNLITGERIRTERSRDSRVLRLTLPARGHELFKM